MELGANGLRRITSILLVAYPDGVINFCFKPMFMI
jgi:hypothetical protein